MLHRSAVPYQTEDGGTRVDALANARIDVSAEVTDGFLVETGENPEWETTDLVVPQHYLAVNLDTEPIVIERKNARGVFEREVMDPGTVWVNPAGRPFSHRIAQSSRFGLLVLNPDLVGRLTGMEETDLTLAYGVHDPQLEHLARVVFAEAAAGTPSGPAFTQTLATALATRLLHRFGTARSSGDSGEARLRQRQTRAVIAFIESRVTTGATLEEMADVAALSPHHFVRAFKASVGVPPYAYLVRRRVERARHLLAHTDRRISRIAYDLGYSDPAHLTRQFKQYVGRTPSAFRRDTRR